MYLLSGFQKVLVDLVPVYYVEESINIFWPSVLVFQIISVLPDINSKYRNLVLRYRTILVWCCHNLKFSIIQDKPAPSASKQTSGFVLEFFPEIINSLELLVNGFQDFTPRLNTFLQNKPEEAMVNVPAAIVPYSCPYVLRDDIEAFQKIFSRIFLQLGIFFQCLIQLVHIALMVLSVMDFHGSCIYEWLKSIICIRKPWQVEHENTGKEFFIKLSVAFVKRLSL